MDYRKIPRHERERMFPKEAYPIINAHLAYKLSQVRNSIAHYKSIPKNLRTNGDENALRVALVWEQCLIWAFPGGRGEPKEGGDLSGQ